jgi:hypothetical protein
VSVLFAHVASAQTAEPSPSPLPAATAMPAATAAPATIVTEPALGSTTEDLVDVPPVSRERFEDGLRDGRADGFRPKPYGWTAGGAVGGLLAGPVGCGVVGGVSLLSKPQPATPPSFGPPASTYYARGYSEGYGTALKKRRTSYAVAGGWAGTLVLGVVALSVAAERNRSGKATFGAVHAGLEF